MPERYARDADKRSFRPREGDSLGPNLALRGRTAELGPAFSGGAFRRRFDTFAVIRVSDAFTTRYAVERRVALCSSRPEIRPQYG